MTELFSTTHSNFGLCEERVMSDRIHGYVVVEPEIFIKDENGLLHCMDGPALVSNKEEYIDVTEAEVGPPALRRGPGEVWYFHGKVHRIGGPAETSGTEKEENWYVNGEWVEDGDTEDYWRACVSFCEEHDIVLPGRSTKHAIPT